MIHPIILDARPAYMGDADTSSLLLAPVGPRRLISLVDSFATDRGWQRAAVLTTFAPAPAYVEALRAAAPLGTVTSIDRLGDVLNVEPSDWLLFFDARHLFLDAAPLQLIMNDVLRSRLRATHLVAMARHRGGTSERVDLDAEGRIRRVHRYFDNATWPFLAGVACSLVPAASLQAGAPPRIESLTDLRSWLTTRAVPCRDVPVDGALFDLRSEPELLRLSERIIAGVDRDTLDDHDGRVHPEARLVGPVVVHPHATIDAGATVIGPAVVGSGARISDHAVVAQCMVADGVTVPPLATVRARAVFRDLPLSATPAAVLSDTLEQAPVAAADIEAPVERAIYPTAKAVAEATVAAAALLVLSPLFVLIAILIKLDSRGGVFFTDVREGRGGRLFRCFKFRTMRMGSDAEQRELMSRNEVDGPQFKLEKDPRLTRLGRWLRPASLDELPQLINVAIGEMSLIGPRPSPFRENQTCVPWRSARLSVRPGITGLWQVCRHDRRDGDFHPWIYFDLLYVQHMSPWVDLKILLATVFTRGGQTHVPVHWIIPSRGLTR
jgi:lipopolysaccharide/colanic/teichoic acid biosynthesis glycosyltransferase